MTLLESKPCPAQRTLLESLGFVLKRTNKVGICLWEFDKLHVELHDTSSSSAEAVIKTLIEAARAEGRSSVRRHLLLVLGMPTEVVDTHGGQLGEHIPTEG